MDLQITGKNVELTPRLRRYVERKLGKLNRYLPSITKSSIEISEEKTKSPQQHYVVQVTLDSNNTLLRGEERGEDLFIAIDKVAQVLSRQIERYKGKLYDRGKGSSLTRSEFSEEVEIQPASKLVKVKRFTIKPASLTEAIEQMELLGHDFYLFFNADTEEINLVYRRKDGDYGLIETKLG